LHIITGMMKIFSIGIIIQLVFISSIFGLDRLSFSAEQEKMIHMAIDSIYNFKFDAADQLISNLANEIPDHPGLYLLKSYYMLWKHNPMKESNTVYNDFIENLRQTIDRSEMILEDSKNDPAALFYTISAYGILARLYVDNGHNYKALNEAQKAYKNLKVALKLTDQFDDLNLMCGIYNYYRVKYPEENPFFKPFTWFLPKGDKNLGLEMLQRGSEHGLFTRAECLSYLYYINLRYEFLPEISLPYATKLNSLYPDNTLYTSLLIENLICLKKYDQIDSLLNPLETDESVIYNYIGSIYRGQYLELYKNDYQAAMTTYSNAVFIENHYDVYSPHYTAVLYLGIGRTFLHLDDKTLAKEYLEKSSRISEYSFIRDEARRLLIDL